MATFKVNSAAPAASKASAPERILPRLRAPRLSFFGRFLLANLVLVVVGSVVIGAWVGQLIQRGVLDRTAAVTALYIEGFVEPHLRTLATQPHLDPSDIAALDQALWNTELGSEVVSLKVWSPTGEILYSKEPSLIAQRLPMNEDARRALGGDISVEMSNLDRPENAFERLHWTRLVEIYVPMRQAESKQVAAVTEFYQLPDELDREVASAQVQSWIVVALAALVSYLLLAGIVKRASNTIRGQESALRGQVDQLAVLLNENTSLQRRVDGAVRRSVARYADERRRTSADLHDGPAQDLAAAMLGLDRIRSRGEADGLERTNGDLAVVQGAVGDALIEIRAIAAGLGMPELGPLPVSEVARQVTDTYERRRGLPLETDFEKAPADASLAVKIALYRSLQEALSNAARHGNGNEVAVRLSTQHQGLELTVSDRGPGLAPDLADGRDHLGIAGMRERAEILGGQFRIESRPGGGATVTVWWPLADPEAGAQARAADGETT
jgi:signal transduction histidine kinase